MATFYLDLFFDDPRNQIGNISRAKKDELVSIARRYNISFNVSMKKQEIKQLVIEGLISQEVISEESRSLISTEAIAIDPSMQIELARIALENRKIEVEARKIEAEVADRKIKAEAEAKRIEAEVEARKIEAEFQTQKEARAHELAVIQARAATNPREDRDQEKFDLAKNSKLVSPFNEQDPDSYFRHFEKTALHLKWPKVQWTWLLQTKLIGKAAIVYNNLDNNDDYDIVKETILAAN